MNDLSLHKPVVNGYLGDMVLPAIDWDYFLAQRKATLQNEPELPEYLLLPEVESLLSVVLDHQQHFLLNTLFHTGIQLNECLALTRGDFHFEGDYPKVSIKTSKTKPGRPSKQAVERPMQRLIPVLDDAYIDECLRYLTSYAGPKNALLFDVNRATVSRWIKAAVKRLDDQGQSLSITVSPITFRHSFAINAIIHFTPVSVLKKLLGHESVRSTEIYTKVHQLENVHYMSRVGFHTKK